MKPHVLEARTGRGVVRRVTGYGSLGQTTLACAVAG
jgi:hypothetical protein